MKILQYNVYQVFAALYNQSDESVFSGKSVDSFESLEVKGELMKLFLNMENIYNRMTGYQKSMENSWVWKELNEVKTIQHREELKQVVM